MQPFLKILLRSALGIGAVVVLIGVATVFIPEYRQMTGLENRCRHLRMQVENKQREIHTIREYQGRLQTDPEFVARIAHQNRRVFPNEVVFVFEEK